MNDDPKHFEVVPMPLVLVEASRLLEQHYADVVKEKGPQPNGTKWLTLGNFTIYIGRFEPITDPVRAQAAHFANEQERMKHMCDHIKKNVDER